MNRLVLLIALLTLPGAAALAGTYKWVDKDGNVHYSDTPVEGAEEVDLPETGTFDAPDPAPRRTVPRHDEEDDAGPAYRAIEFISPRTDQVFWATGGRIPVQLSLEPGLRPGHAVNLYLNGELTEDSPMRDLGLTLTEVYRGAHTVRAAIVDQDGEEVAATETVTFHVKQRSLANPQGRN